MRYTLSTVRLSLALAMVAFLATQAHAVSTPVVDASLKLWLDASSQGTGALASWVDVSGNGNNANVSFGAAPINTAGAIGGMNAVLFNGTNISTTPVFLNTGPYSLFAVTQTTGGPNERVISSGNKNWLLGYWGTQRDRFYAEGWVAQSNTAPGTAPHLYAGAGTGQGGADFSVLISDGGVVAANGGGKAAPGSVSLGGWGLTTTEKSSAYVAEVLAYNRVLTPAEERQVGEYLTQKYSLNTSYDGNIALHQPVIDGSGAYPNIAFNTGTYSALHAVDGFLDDRVDGNPGFASYWLGKDGDSTEYFVVDLGDSQVVKSIGLRNTHNQAANDRGTRQFVLRGSNDLAAITGGAPTAPIILSGKLSTSLGPNFDTLIPVELFNRGTGLAVSNYRYLRFETLASSFQGLGVPAVDGGPTNGHVGLNELLVYTDDRGGNVAAGKPIVAGSGAYFNDPNPNSGLFSAAHVTDQRLDDFRDDANPSRTSYWLGREGQNNEFFVIDLGADFVIDRIDLQNSHNGGFNDRGTARFNIKGSIDGVSFFDIFTDTLANVAGLGNQIPIESFSVANGDFMGFRAQFIRFEAETRYGNSAALNEIFVFGQVPIPEPMTGAMLLLAIGAVAMRRRRAA